LKTFREIAAKYRAFLWIKFNHLICYLIYTLGTAKALITAAIFAASASVKSLGIFAILTIKSGRIGTGNTSVPGACECTFWLCPWWILSAGLSEGAAGVVLSFCFFFWFFCYFH